MTINTCVKAMNPRNPPPVTLLFKDEGDLATHPPSCRSQRVIGR